MGSVQGCLPGIGKTLFQRDKDFVDVFVIVGPVRSSAARTVIAVFAAVGVPARQATPGWAVNVNTLVFITGRQAGGVTQIRIDNPGEEHFFAVVAVKPGVVILISGDDAGAHIAIFG
ncbi:hypothetical protein D3C73_1217340 [compost metagenome]